MRQAVPALDQTDRSSSDPRGNVRPAGGTDPSAGASFCGVAWGWPCIPVARTRVTGPVFDAPPAGEIPAREERPVCATLAEKAARELVDNMRRIMNRIG